jgi:tetratricopeptide (TPR) repeat protein
MNTEEIFTFIAIWNEESGINLEDLYPKEEQFDFNTIAEHIFITYHNFYKKEAVVKTLFKIPLVNISKKASIFLDRIQGDSIVIVVILFPDYSSDDIIEIFDNMIQNIGMEYIETEQPLLDKYFNKIKEKFLLEQKVKDSDIVLDENYLLPEALQDFKTGLEQYQRKEFDRAYFLLRKAYLRFETEDQLKLLLETTFFIATILMQKNKFKAAKEFFQKLGPLAEQLEHQKYIEKAIYMEGYCYYQEGDYTNAYNNFTLLGKTELKFTSIFQYLTLFGKILADVGHYEDALKTLEKALEISEKAAQNREVQRKRAEIFLDLGHICYEMVHQAIKSGNIDKKASNLLLNSSIKHFEDVIKIWKNLDNYPGLIETYQLIASNYEILGDIDSAIENYESSLEFAELSNDLVNRFKLLELIIQKYAEQESHEKIVRKIDVILHEIAPVAYLDLFTIAGFHLQLGESMIELKRHNEAISELVVSLNLYTKMPKPVQELSKVHKKLIEIYELKEDQQKIDYYKNKSMQVQEQLEDFAIKEKIKHQPLEVVEEFWIFSNEGGTIFSYTPKANTTPGLLSNFMIAMDNFGAELQVDQIKTLKIGYDYFSYYKEVEHNIFMVGRSPVKFELDNIEKTVQKIYMKFWAVYEPILQNYDGDSSKFEGFIKTVRDLD